MTILLNKKERILLFEADFKEEEIGQNWILILK